MKEELILVDENDRCCGHMEKMEVHLKGILHRAFSVFVFNSADELLLQQRAFAKYHSAGLWSNSCCSHPRKGESLEHAVNRRMQEELGMQVTAEHMFSFIYKARLSEGLTEHEFDHVYFAQSNELPLPNAQEIQAIKYITLAELAADIDIRPQHYSAWLKITLPQVIVAYKIYKNRQDL